MKAPLQAFKLSNLKDILNFKAIFSCQSSNFQVQENKMFFYLETRQKNSIIWQKRTFNWEMDYFYLAYRACYVKVLCTSVNPSCLNLILILFYPSLHADIRWSDLAPWTHSMTKAMQRKSQKTYQKNVCIMILNLNSCCELSFGCLSAVSRLSLGCLWAVSGLSLGCLLTFYLTFHGHTVFTFL